MGGRCCFSCRTNAVTATRNAYVGMTPKKTSRFGLSLVLPATILAGILVALLLCIPLSAMSGWPAELGSPDPLALNAESDNKPGAQVAHAFGEIDGVSYTNSREAFLSNYEKGFRIFEVDLVLLKDGSVFCAHDGSEWMYGLDNHFTETTAAELSGRPCLGKYTALIGSDLLDLIDEYPDASFLLDAKRTTQSSHHEILEALVSEARERHPSVLDRMIPHTFGPIDLCEVAKIYPFGHYWVAVFNYRRNADGTSGAEQDRIVIYIISHGGPLSLLRATDIPADSALPSRIRAAVFFSLRYPSYALYDIKVYVSADVIAGDPAPGPS